jgi:NAD(P)H dehydrogenase (quinone)
MARDAAKAAALLGRDVEIATGDLRDPASLTTALAGIECASFATSPSPSMHEEEINFIGAARTAKVRRLVKLSGFGVEFADDSIHRAHVESERRLRESGIPHVVLRPLIFMTNMFMDLAAIQAGKLPSLFGDSRVNFVDPRDVGELIARALIDANYEGQIWEFGGPEALSYDDLATTFTGVLGRPIEHLRMEPEAFEASAAAAGLPDFVIEAVTGAATAARAGKYATSDEVVQRVLGRRASTFRDWVVRNRDAFRAEVVG